MKQSKKRKIFNFYESTMWVLHWKWRVDWGTRGKTQWPREVKKKRSLSFNTNKYHVGSVGDTFPFPSDYYYYQLNSSTDDTPCRSHHMHNPTHTLTAINPGSSSSVSDNWFRNNKTTNLNVLTDSFTWFPLTLLGFSIYLFGAVHFCFPTTSLVPTKHCQLTKVR
jgi:hypothetical protein